MPKTLKPTAAEVLAKLQVLTGAQNKILCKNLMHKGVMPPRSLSGAECATSVGMARQIMSNAVFPLGGSISLRKSLKSWRKRHTTARVRLTKCTKRTLQGGGKQQAFCGNRDFFCGCFFFNYLCCIMKTYLINIKFTDGDEAHIRCEAENQATALARLETSPQFVDFVDGKVIDSLTVEIDKNPPSQGEYLLQPSKDACWWVATDKKNNCVIKFREGAYNETAKITFLEDMPEADALELASVIRGLGDFLAANHPDLV